MSTPARKRQRPDSGNDAEDAATVNVARPDDDLTLVCQPSGKKVNACKAFLAAHSPVFRDMFTLGDGAEAVGASNSSTRLSIDVDDDPEMLKTALKWTYPEHVPTYDVRSLRTFAVAKVLDKYAIWRGLDALAMAYEARVPSASPDLLTEAYILFAHLGLIAERNYTVRYFLEGNVDSDYIKGVARMKQAHFPASDLSQLISFLSSRHERLSRFRTSLLLRLQEYYERGDSPYMGDPNVLFVIGRSAQHVTRRALVAFRELEVSSCTWPEDDEFEAEYWYALTEFVDHLPMSF